jgi:mono/diheme cytochrome c family protein
MRRLKRLFLWAVVLLLLIQAVPYGWDHTNPAVAREPAWASPRVRELAKKACFDCHSNETKWEWYTNVAPIRWLVAHDVMEAREHMNFSEWDRPQPHADDAAHEVETGDMPLDRYLWGHPEARLTEAERAELVAGLRGLRSEAPAR